LLPFILLRDVKEKEKKELIPGSFFLPLLAFTLNYFFLVFCFGDDTGFCTVFPLDFSLRSLPASGTHS